MPGRRWTAKEDRILRAHYWRGGVAVAQKLRDAGITDRKPRAANERARKLGLRAGSQVFVPAADVHSGCAHHASRRILSAARRAGVLIDAGPASRPRWYVPESWAEAYTTELGDAVLALRRGWLQTRDLARVMGVSTTHMSNAIHASTRCPELQAAVRGIRRLPHPKTIGYIWHPEDARAAAAQFKRRRAAGRWTKQDQDVVRRYYAVMGQSWCAERLGRSKNAVRAMARRLGVNHPMERAA